MATIEASVHNPLPEKDSANPNPTNRFSQPYSAELFRLLEAII